MWEDLRLHKGQVARILYNKSSNVGNSEPNNHYHRWVISKQIIQYFLGSYGHHLRFCWNLAEMNLSVTEMNPENFSFLSSVVWNLYVIEFCAIFPFLGGHEPNHIYAKFECHNYILTGILFSLKLFTPVVFHSN